MGRSLRSLARAGAVTLPCPRPPPPMGRVLRPLARAGAVVCLGRCRPRSLPRHSGCPRAGALGRSHPWAAAAYALAAQPRGKNTQLAVRLAVRLSGLRSGPAKYALVRRSAGPAFGRRTAVRLSRRPPRWLPWCAVGGAAPVPRFAGRAAPCLLPPARRPIRPMSLIAPRRGVGWPSVVGAPRTRSRRPRLRLGRRCAPSA